MLRGKERRETGGLDSDLDWGWGASGSVLAGFCAWAETVRANTSDTKSGALFAWGFFLELLTISKDAK
jgi:hypothetical protein